MKTKALIIALIVLSWSSFAQKISNIDFDNIKTKITDSTSQYYYPSLISRFIKADTTLTDEEYSYIYYGNVFSKNYNPYSTSKNEDKFLETYNKEKFKKAISYGEKVLKENPINLKISFKMAVCYNILGDKKTAKHYAKRYFPLLNVIYGSGDGKSIETAYVVIKVSDEYQILADLEFNSIKQALIGDTDVLTISMENQEEEPKIPELYFNVSKPLDFLQKEFEEK